MNLTLRWPPPASQWLCCAWLAFAVAVTARPFLWHVEYFRNPGPRFYTLFLALLPVLALVLVAYPLVRRRTLWRHEPAVFAAFLAAVPLLYEPVAALVTLWMLASCYAVGRWVRRKLDLEVPGPAGELAVSAALGFGLLMFILFWMGLAGWYYRWTMTALLAVSCLAFWRELGGLPGQLVGILRRWQAEEEFRSPLAGILVVFAALLLACGMAVALAPSLAFDVLRMHLPAAHYYAGRHALQPLPLLSYSYFPQGGEVLMTAALLLGGQPAAQLLSPLFFALLLLLLYATARRCFSGPLAAFAGCVFGASFPFLHWTGSVAKNDMIMALLQLTGLYGYLRWRESRNFNWILAGAFTVAMSFAVKHLALFGAIPLCLLYLGAAWREARRWRALASLVLVLAAFGLEWHVRTYLLTGNPVYPMTLRRSTTPAVGRPGLNRTERLVHYLAAPYRVHFLGRLAFESPSENPAGVALVLFGPVCLLLRRRLKVPAERAGLLFSGIYLVYWAAEAPVLRYAIVPALLVAAFTAARLVAFWQTAARWMRGVLSAAVAYSLLFALCVAMILEVNGPQLRYFVRRIDKAQYLREALRTYGSLEFLRTRWKAGDRVYGVGNCSYAYAPDSSAMDCSMPSRAGYSIADVPKVLGNLRARDYRFLIVQNDSIRAPLIEAIPPARRPIPIYHDPYFAVYELVREKAPG